jgi:hypothetical protein
MDLRRARVWEWLAGAFGIALAVSVFLDWYGCAATRSAGAGCRPGAAVSAWGALAVADLVMLVAGLGGLLALVVALVQRTPAVPIALTSIVTVVALVAAVLAVLRLVDAPDLPGITGQSPARLLGAWLGAGASLGLVASLLAAIRDERVPVAARGVDGAHREPRLLTVSPTGSPGGSSGEPRETGGTA